VTAALSADRSFSFAGAARPQTNDVRPQADDYRVARLTSLDALEALAPEWTALEARTKRATFFQSAAWSLAACRPLAGQTEITDVLVFAVYRGLDLVAVAPFKIISRGPVRLAVDLTDPFGQYGDVLIADGVDALTVMTHVIEALRNTANLDGLLMRRVRADSPARHVVDLGGFKASAADAAPYVDLRPHATFDSYYSGVNAKTRKNLRNLRNRMARGAPVTHRVVDNDDIANVIAESFEGRLRWLEQQGLPSTAFDDPVFRAFVERIGELGRRGELTLLAMGLYCGDVPVSLQWGFVHGGRYYAYIAARNPDFDAYSPGRIHLEEVIRTCHARGIEVCDFLAPGARYKFTWTDDATEVLDIAVPFSFKGRLLLDLWNRRLRVMAKAVYARLPPSLRQIAMRLLRGKGHAAQAEAA
jgi:CelD/BcsL family acetyltransferase involved in cellulose biosynthesis